MRDIYSPPNWFPTAIATNQGWVNPITGEILVSRKNLLSMINALSEDNKTHPEEQEVKESIENKKEDSAESPIVETTNETTEVIAEVITEENTTLNEETIKKGRKRKA